MLNESGVVVPLNGVVSSKNVNADATTTTTTVVVVDSNNNNTYSDGSTGLTATECMQVNDANNNTTTSNNYMLESSSKDSLIMDHENDMSSMDYQFSRTNLIVNYLPQNMTQDEIKELFASIGQVESCKLIKDKMTGQSLGYSFVNYFKQEDADKAVNDFNGMKLQNKTIKVSLARPSSESIKGANLYVCGLPKEFAQSELEKMFTEFGTIISSKILTDPKTGESKGVGFVRFDKRNEAEAAIEKLNGKIYENIVDPLVVKFANTPTSFKSSMGNPLTPFMPTYRNSGGYFQPFRSTSHTSYRYSPMNAGYCQGDFNSLMHQTAPMNGLTTTLANSLRTTPSFTSGITHQPTSLTSANPVLISPHNISTNSLASMNYSGWPIFVYNLGPESDESLLWQLFGPFGAVQNVKVIRDMQTLKCKGFGFVTMTNYEEALSAINCLNGFTLNNRILQVSFKTSSPSKQIA